MKKRICGSIASHGERALIDRLTRCLPKDPSVMCGIGDDCAVLKKDKHTYQLFTTDMTIAHVHFNPEAIQPQAIGYKALARNISDIAAMGGIPQYAVVALALPPSCTLVYVDKLYAGIRKCASRFSVTIVGGDIARAKAITVTISVIGFVEKKRLVLRQGARPGDIIFVTGSLGGSIRTKHAHFIPRIEEARFLTKHASIHAMIDISDGLLQDLGHILDRSNVGCILDKKRIPLSHDAVTCAQGKPLRALNHALYDGEDFELLFTVSPKESDTVLKKWRRHFHTRLTPIGTIYSQKSLARHYPRHTASVRHMPQIGYAHF